MRSFIKRHLEPVERLGEVLFGLIMALGIIGAVRLEQDEPENRALFIGIFGCNLAWAIVDGVMFVLTTNFQRGSKARLMRDVQAAPTETAALARIAEELGGPLMQLTTDAERAQLYGSVLNIIRRGVPEESQWQAKDFLGAAAVALIIMIATFPVVLPYLIVSNPYHAVRISQWIALAELFWLGLWWGRMVGRNPILLAAGLTLVGGILVIVTILLGG
jgi:VIT1/CCC1 family predicted Fe2+/Mn2+ transporter